MRHHLLISLLSYSVALAACRSKPPVQPANLLQWVEPGTATMMQIGDLSHFSTALFHYAKGLGGSKQQAFIQSTLKKLVADSGLDPTLEQSWRTIGLSPKSGAVLFTHGSSTQPVLVMGLHEPSTFDKFIQHTIKKHATRLTMQRGSDQGHPYYTLIQTNTSGTEPAMHWTYLKSCVVMVGAKNIAAVHQLIQRAKYPPKDATPSPTIADTDIFQKLNTATKKKVFTLFFRGVLGSPSPHTSLASSEVHAMFDTDMGQRGLEAELRIIAPDNLEILALLGQTLSAHSGDSPSSHLPKEPLLKIETKLLSSTFLAPVLRFGDQNPQTLHDLNSLSESFGIDPFNDLLPLFVGPVHLGFYVEDPLRLIQQWQKSSWLALREHSELALSTHLRNSQAMLALLKQMASQERPFPRQIKHIGGPRDPQMFVLENTQKPVRQAWKLTPANSHLIATFGPQISKIIKTITSPKSQAKPLPNAASTKDMHTQDGSFLKARLSTRVFADRLKSRLGAKLLKGSLAVLEDFCREFDSLHLDASLKGGLIHINLSQSFAHEPAP
jgi:hypothetical protein